MYIREKKQVAEQYVSIKCYHILKYYVHRRQEKAQNIYQLQNSG